MGWFTTDFSFNITIMMCKNLYTREWINLHCYIRIRFCWFLFPSHTFSVLPLISSVPLFSVPLLPLPPLCSPCTRASSSWRCHWGAWTACLWSRCRPPHCTSSLRCPTFGSWRDPRGHWRWLLGPGTSKWRTGRNAEAWCLMPDARWAKLHTMNFAYECQSDEAFPNS